MPATPKRAGSYWTGHLASIEIRTSSSSVRYYLPTDTSRLGLFVIWTNGFGLLIESPPHWSQWTVGFSPSDPINSANLRASASDWAHFKSSETGFEVGPEKETQKASAASAPKLKIIGTSTDTKIGDSGAARVIMFVSLLSIITSYRHAPMRAVTLGTGRVTR